MEMEMEIFARKKISDLLSRAARRIVSAVIWVAVFHFPKLLTATA